MQGDSWENRHAKEAAKTNWEELRPDRGVEGLAEKWTMHPRLELGFGMW